MRTPKPLADRPALLINLAADRRTSLDDDPYRIVPDIFLAAGHQVASFDLPKHGELADDYGSGLQGMANAIAGGEDPFDEIRQVGQALITNAVQMKWAESIYACGTSRGGLVAMHLLAEIGQVKAAGVIIPATYLPALAEFHDLASHPTVRNNNAESLIPKLRNRRLMVMIGETDPRVDASKCREFVKKLAAVSDRVKPVLVTGQGQSHGGSYSMEHAYKAVADYLLNRCFIDSKRY